MEGVADAVREEGFAGPVALLTPAECTLLVEHLRYRPTMELAWHKGLAVVDRLVFDFATRPPLLELLRELLGEEAVLWGASLVARRPGDRHVWHTDIETAAPDTRAVSVWVGLQGTMRETGLRLVTRSHRFGRPLEQVAAEHGLARGQTTDDAVISFAEEIDPEARLEQPEISDGQALVFDGRLWHGSDNTGSGERLALLLQYATADTEIGIPDPDRLGWPFSFRPEKPPVIRISGRTNGSPNLDVPAPPAHVGAELAPRVRDVVLPLPEDPGLGITSHCDFTGFTPNVAEMTGHITVLSPGHCPHALQAHIHEELVVVLDGEAELWFADGPVPAEVPARRLRPGDVLYYPAYQHHTVRALGDAPLTYLVLKWWGEPAGTESPAGVLAASTAELEVPGDEPFRRELLFEEPTAFLSRLHCHLTVLEPGAGYDAHTDEHDVAIVLLSGRIEVNGAEAGPHGVLFLPAGRAHDMRNVGSQPARYVVAEWHAARRRPDPAPAEESERDRLARELHDVLTSSSWRLTAPLRRLAAAARARRH